jgi:hypothetical protein
MFDAQKFLILKKANLPVFFCCLSFWSHIQETIASWVPMAHACNPSYSGCRDQEDQGLKPAQANSSQDPISKKPSQKRGKSS